MKKIILLFILMSNLVFSQQPIDTIRLEGKKVVVYDDKTWDYIEEEKPNIREEDDNNWVFENYWITSKANFSVDKKDFPSKLIQIELANQNHPKVFMPHNGVKTSSFGYRWGKKHKGIDLGLQKGQQIVSCFDGIVRITRNNGGYGKLVIVRHYNGLETFYAHLSEIQVKPGEKISAGEIIGLGGSSGHSTGPHLHFEIRYFGVEINPELIFNFSEGKLRRKSFVIDRDIFFK